MPKYLINVLFYLLAILITPSVVFAANLSLLNIGNLQTQGNQYRHWWYTATNPILSGLADPSSQVNITIDDQQSSAQSDTSGNWSFQPTSLTNGDHNVVIADTSSSYTFTLTIGSDMPDNATSPTTTQTASQPGTLLRAGNQGLTLVILLGGISLIFTDYKLAYQKKQNY